LRALFLIDGEHYPPVVLDAMQSVRDSLGAEGVAAAFLGGTEKLKEGADYGVPLVTDRDPVSTVERALSEHAVEVVVDLSDEPVVGYRERMRIASLVLSAGAHQDPEYIAGFLGTYRLLISDLLVLTMSEEPMAGEEKVRGIVEGVREIKPDLDVIPAVFRPRPVGEIGGLRVAYVSTAPPAVLDTLARHLEERYGCEVVAASGSLSDRKRLVRDLDGMAGVEAYLTEIKAAAVDVVTRRGADEGKPVLYCDNDPVGEGLDEALLRLAREAETAGRP
jgi:predicted GTPase